MRAPARAGLILLALALTSAGAQARSKGPPKPTGELRLDMDDPVIELKIGKVPMRLRVAIEQKRLIQLNPAAADRLRAQPPLKNFAFETGFDAEVGRQVLKGVQAAVPVTINGNKMLVTAAAHERDCCVGVDGEIGITLLPYATIRFIRNRQPTPSSTVASFLIDDDNEHGPESRISLGKADIFVQFSLSRPDSVATYSAGVLLARKHGGRLTTKSEEHLAAFGVMRPTRLLRFTRPASIAGFRFDNLPVRTADFAGKLDFPPEPVEDGDIVVARKMAQQRAWPVVMIGRDRMDHCDDAEYDALTRELRLRCDFGAPS